MTVAEHPRIGHGNLSTPLFMAFNSTKYGDHVAIAVGLTTLPLSPERRESQRENEPQPMRVARRSAAAC
jgi:hypothetical protein